MTDYKYIKNFDSKDTICAYASNAVDDNRWTSVTLTTSDGIEMFWHRGTRVFVPFDDASWETFRRKYFNKISHALKNIYQLKTGD